MNDNGFNEIGLKPDYRFTSRGRTFHIVSMRNRPDSVKSGELDLRVKVQRPTVNSAGEHTGDFEDAGKRWAKLEELTGREALIAVQSVPVYTHRFTMSYRGQQVLVNCTEIVDA